MSVRAGNFLKRFRRLSHNNEKLLESICAVTEQLSDSLSMHLEYEPEGG